MRGSITKFAGVASVAAALLVAGGGPNRASAAVMEVDTSSTSETNFDANILATDLVNQGRPSFASIAATGSPSFPATGSNDNTATHTNGLTYWGGTHAAGEDLTYTLNTNPGTGGSATGYDITSINSIYGWQDSRYRHAAQEWVVSVETLTSPTTFQPLKTVVYAPFASNDNAAGSTQVTLSDTTGRLATGVIAVQFHVNPYTGTGFTNELGVIREYDVIGSATAVPEPAGIALFCLAGLGALARRRRSH